MKADADQAAVQDRQAEEQEKSVCACRDEGQYDYNTLSIIINFTESPFVHSRKEYDKNVHELELALRSQRHYGRYS